MALKVVVLCGGLSAEREVSLRSGDAVFQSLNSLGYVAAKVDVTRNVVTDLVREKPDVVFIALHGKYGEDGTMQGLLEILGIPYTGSGVLASAVAMDKICTKNLLAAVGINTAPFRTILRDAATAEAAKSIADVIGFPLVVKAACQGSTIGTYIVRDADGFEEAVREALGFDDHLLVEKFIPGMEVTVAVLGNNDPVALPPIEIVSASGIYDYQAKYTAGMSDHIIPARIPGETDARIRELALKTYKSIGCRGFARVDMIIDWSQNPFVLEVNTIPGLTSVSLFPDAARAGGIEFPELIDRLVKLAMER